MRYGVGQPLRRKEDARLLTGAGRFVEDISLENQCYACIVYADHAHANIIGVDTEAARSASGVIAVFTGRDAADDGIGPIGPRFMPEDMGGPKGYRTERRILALDRVRHVGERVAVVIAETRDSAAEAAELIDVEYEPLPVVVGAEAATAPGAPPIYDGAEGNVSFTAKFGDAGATEQAFGDAAHVVSVPLHHERLAAAPLEPRACIGDYAAADHLYTLYTGTQAPHILRSELARMVLHVPETQVRVVVSDVGGGFGMKTTPFPEDGIVMWAARKVGRPVKWVATRSETMLGDDQGRGQTGNAELALDQDGRFLALRVALKQDVGAYIVGAGAIPPIHAGKLLPSVYRFPEVDLSCSAVFTNAPPTTPYRGAGRPEAIFAVERLVDEAARITGIDRVELRRRNLLEPEELPYKTQTGFVYDSGEFANVLDKCVALADWDGFDGRRAESERRGLLRGLGICYYVDDAGNLNDQMELRFDPSGSLTIFAGTMSTGQGHETTFAQMVADWLGVPFENVRVVQGDTRNVQFGRGTYATRSVVVGGSALRVAADRIIEKGRKFASVMMEASPEDLEFAQGEYRVTGTDRTIELLDVARASFRPGMPVEEGVGLVASGGFAVTQPSFPNGCHICEVEIDPDTGGVSIVRFSVTDDIGRVINPLIVDGQVHGGVAQGIGEALCERVVYEKESGQLFTGALMDYCLPRADDLPNVETAYHEVPCRTNPIGVKGVGEGGTIGATPAVISAVLDALAPLGVRDIRMPASPENVWNAIRNAGSG